MTLHPTGQCAGRYRLPVFPAQVHWNVDIGKKITSTRKNFGITLFLFRFRFRFRYSDNFVSGNNVTKNTGKITVIRVFGFRFRFRYPSLVQRRPLEVR